MEKWKVYAKKADFQAIGKKFDIDPVVARVIRNRDVVSEEEYMRYLNPDISRMYSPYLMKDIEKACDIILNGIKEHKKIQVVGDYDIDGVCSGNILTQGFEEIGADVDFAVPDRIEDGYGINQQMIKRAYDEGVELIVTCDNGIAAMDAIEYAKNLGMEIVVTDHHEVQYVETDGVKKYLIPKADAVVDPKRPDDEYPFKELCGAGVAYKVISILFEKKGKSNKDVEKYLELAAIATIGDVVDLKDENRIITVAGLKMLNNTQNPGLKSLINETGLTDRTLSSYHIGFVIGPCLNAGGRLDSAQKSYGLLKTRDINEAETIAKELKELNDERKNITADQVDIAVRMIEEDERYKNDRVLVLLLEKCHESVVGIVAGRLREKYNKPVIVLTKVKDGLKGSGRSIEEYNMFEELIQCRHLFQKFGGHPMAAGLSLEEQNFEELRTALNNNTTLTEEDLCRKVWIDVAMPFNYITFQLVEQLSRLEPFGKGNEKPVFAQKDVKVGRISVFGEKRNVMRFDMHDENGFVMQGTLFRDADEVLSDLEEKFSKDDVNKVLSGQSNNIRISVTYYPEINEYRGRRNIRVVIQRYL